MTSNPGDPILAIENLSVTFETNQGEVNAVKAVSIHANAGETVAIVGESGSGKSQTLMAAIGLLADNGKAVGTARYRHVNMIGLPRKELNKIRGRKITMIFQEPMTSLDPLYTIGRQISELIVYHSGISWRDARQKSLELLELVQIQEPERRIRSYPHELSGGQRQRVMIAMALANDPDVLIADEPTTALDVTTQAKILDLLADLQKRLGMAIVFITHDLGIVRRFSDRVYVMKEGEVVENGNTAEIFNNPGHSYTKMLLDAEPEGRKQPVGADSPILLNGSSVSVEFQLDGGFLTKKRLLQAVNRVDVSLREGQTVGVVGESGSGKSTLGRALLKLHTYGGQVQFNGRNLESLVGEDLRSTRREMQLVFQDPFGSLSPRMTVGEIVTEGLLVHEPSLSSKDRDNRSCQALEEVALDPSMRNRYPHEFSGGQRQRIAIARTMVLKPRLVVLDEPTSALDRTIQKQIIELLRQLQTSHGLTYLFISHDLAVVRAMSDEIMVMRNGSIVEKGTPDDIFLNPQQDYTRELISASELR